MKKQSELIGKNVGLLVYSGKTNTVSVVWRTISEDFDGGKYVRFSEKIYGRGGGVLSELIRSEKTATKRMEEKAKLFGNKAVFNFESCTPPG